MWPFKKLKEKAEKAAREIERQKRSEQFLNDELAKLDAKPKQTKTQAVKEIVDGVTNLDECKVFEANYEDFEKRFRRLGSIGIDRDGKDYRRLEKKMDAMEAAYWKLGDKAFGWQFIPDIDVDTPIAFLENAYKVFSNEELREAKKTLSKSNDDWHPINGCDAPEKMDEQESVEIKFLINFISIIESSEEQQSQIDKINDLVAVNKEAAESFLCELGDDNFTTGDMWFADRLQDDGLPLAYELYQDGYTTPEKCLEIDIDGFLSRKGVGKVKHEQLKKYQSKVKRRIKKN